jgi:hypothetical protein
MNGTQPPINTHIKSLTSVAFGESAYSQIIEVQGKNSSQNGYTLFGIMDETCQTRCAKVGIKWMERDR